MKLSEEKICMINRLKDIVSKRQDRLNRLIEMNTPEVIILPLIKLLNDGKNELAIYHNGCIREHISKLIDVFGKMILFLDEKKAPESLTEFSWEIYKHYREIYKNAHLWLKEDNVNMQLPDNKNGLLIQDLLTFLQASDASVDIISAVDDIPVGQKITKEEEALVDAIFG